MVEAEDSGSDGDFNFGDADKEKDQKDAKDKLDGIK